MFPVSNLCLWSLSARQLIFEAAVGQPVLLSRPSTIHGQPWPRETAKARPNPGVRTPTPRWAVGELVPPSLSSPSCTAYVVHEPSPAQLPTAIGSSARVILKEALPYQYLWCHWQWAVGLGHWSAQDMVSGLVNVNHASSCAAIRRAEGRAARLS